jgi:acetyl-CoA synthetase
MTGQALTIESLLKENRVFKPTQEFVNQSNVKKWMDSHDIKDLEHLFEKAKDIEWFWSEVSKSFVNWYKPFEKVLDWTPPLAKWFTGAKYNIVNDAVDQHIKTWRKNKVAYIFEGENGEVKKLTYRELYVEVNKLANALKNLGVKKGDRVGIYLPMIPQLPIAMLACAKIGAIHNVVFSGFSSKAFRERVNDSESKAVITCDGYYRRGKIIPLKEQTDEALNWAPSIENTIVYKHIDNEVPWDWTRDHWWHEITAYQPPICETEKLEANEPLYILYTSGTTGKPKGVIHDHGGYAVGIAMTLSWVFDIKETDVWWCAADIGWVTGHSYIVYAPLILGATSILYEGAPDYPRPNRWWSIIDRHGVTILYTSPTAIRMHMRYGESWAKRYDLSSLRLLGSVGEPINPEAWTWYYKHIGRGRCQIMDTWWQTETGSFVISPLPLTTLKPGSVTKPLPGFQAATFDDEGLKVAKEGGNLVLLAPWPAMLKGLYNDPQGYNDRYWTRFEKCYLTGDVARIDEEGYVWIQGRADDVLKVSAHRISNAEVESALVSHADVAEAAVIGKPHNIKGESIAAFVVLREETAPSDELRSELIQHVRKEIGGIAKPDELWFVRGLPKTRSGKIMRRVVKAKALGTPTGDITTLSNPETVSELEHLK